MKSGVKFHQPPKQVSLVIVQEEVNLNQTGESIARAAEEAQRLLDVQFAECDDQPPPGSALNQAGLRNGKEIVMEYLSHGEEGIALEQVIYMVTETGIDLSQEARKQIRKAASAMGMKVRL